MNSVVLRSLAGPRRKLFFFLLSVVVLILALITYLAQHLFLGPLQPGSLPASLPLAPAAQVVLFISLVVLLFVLTWVGTLLLVAGYLRTIQAAMQRLSAGDYQVRLPSSNALPLLPELEQVFNAMAETVEQRQTDCIAKNTYCEAAEQALRSTERELQRVNRVLRVLNHANQAVVNARTEAELAHHICQMLVQVGGYTLAWVGRAECDAARLITPLAQVGDTTGYLTSLAATWADTEHGHSPSGQAIRTGQPVWVRDIATEPSCLPWRDTALQAGYASAIALPLYTEQKVFGVLNIYATDADAFDQAEVALLTDLSHDLAYGIVSLRVRQAQAQAEAALRESEELHRLTLSAISDVIFMTNQAGQFTFICGNVVGLFGYAPQEISTLGNVAQLLGDNLFDPQEMEQTGAVINLEREVEDQQGRVHTILVNVQRVQIRGGTLLYTCRDITLRKQIEQVLHRERDLLNRLMATNPSAITVVDRTGQIVFANPRAEQVLGLTRTAILHRSYNDPEWHITDVFGQPLLEAELPFCRVLQTRQPVHNIRHAIVWPDGKRVVLSISGAPLQDAAGQIGSVIFAMEDITSLVDMELSLQQAHAELELRVAQRTAELQQANVRLEEELHQRQLVEDELRENKRFMQQLADASPSILYIYDLLEQRTIYTNQQVSVVLGYTPGALRQIGHSLFTLMHPDDCVHYTEHIARLNRSRDGEIIETEYRLRHANGEWRWLSSRDTIFKRTAEGNAHHILGTARDITAHKQSEANLQLANGQLRATVVALEQRTHEITLLSELGEVLQVCATAQEAYTAITRYVRRLFPKDVGALWVQRDKQPQFELVAHWGDIPAIRNEIATDSCWSLRRGRLHSVDDTHTSLVCKHVQHIVPYTRLLCVPLVAQGKTLGVLHLQLTRPTSTQQEDVYLYDLAAKERLVIALAEHIALALANMHLREKLHHQAIHDPLTGLFNRRYMEEALEREVRRANRTGRPLGVIMLDIDHFKVFNDTYGHAGGDALLAALGELLRDRFRGEDIACRYGGEEFILLLPEASLDDTWRRATDIQHLVRLLQVQHAGQPLASITLSLGVAALPEHGLTGKDLLQTADAALYQAKLAGRDRIVVGTWRLKSSA